MLLLPLIGHTADIPKAVSDEVAAREARGNQALAVNLWDSNVRACESRNLPTLFSIMKTVDTRLEAQPDDHQKYRARFVYSGCRQMLLNVASLNGACLNKIPDEQSQQYASKRWKDDSAQCAREIESPDLGYDVTKPVDRKQELLSEGYTGDEAEEVMRVMRKAAGENE